MHSSVRHITVSSDEAGQRIDNFLLKHLKGVPKTHVYRLLRKGEVRVNKGRIKPVYRVVEGDVVRLPPIRMAEAKSELEVPDGLAKRLINGIVYEDVDYLVVNKPAGLASHGGSGLSFGLIEAMRQIRKDLRYLELGHRLDRETSGCILFAKKRSALTVFQELQRNQSITKQYLALMCGHLPLKKLTVSAKLETRKLSGGERVVKVSDEGKLSETHFEVLDTFGEYDFVKATLGTGRTHQIRVHAQYENAPLAGDPKYGNKQHNQQLRSVGLKRLFLHAAHLAFEHPVSGKQYDFSAELEPELRGVLDRLSHHV